MRSAKHLANNSHSFPLLSCEDIRKMKTVSLDADIRAVCEQRGAECQVSLSGRITIDSSPDLLALFLRQVESLSCRILTVDLHEVAYVDISGLAILVETLKAARTQGKAFRLNGLQERPRYLLEATRLLHLFEDAQSAQPLWNVSAVRPCATSSMWARLLFSLGMPSVPWDELCRLSAIGIGGDRQSGRCSRSASMHFQW